MDIYVITYISTWEHTGQYRKITIILLSVACYLLIIVIFIFFGVSWRKKEEEELVLNMCIVDVNKQI